MDIKNGRVVKGTNFEGLKDVDDPVALAAFTTKAARTSWFYDITASAEGRSLFTDVLMNVAKEIFILTVGAASATFRISTACSNAARTR